MINNVTLIGRLTKDVELRQMANGQSNATFTLAVTRNFKNQNREYESDFIQVVAWRNTAEFLTRFGAKKGNLLGVTGRIQTRNYENQQGQRVYVTEVVADNINFLESQATRGNRPLTNSHQAIQQQINNFDTTSVSINDDDLPF